MDDTGLEEVKILMMAETSSLNYNLQISDYLDETVRT